MRLVSSIVFAALVLAGCDNPNGPKSDLIRASAANRTLAITNISSDPLYYFAANKETLALLDWVPCTDPSACKALGSKATTRISYYDIFGEPSTGGHVVIFHWRLVPTTPGKYNVDSIRSLEVELR